MTTHRGLMQDRPLTISTLLARAETSFGHKRVITGGDGSAYYTLKVAAKKLVKAKRNLVVRYYGGAWKFEDAPTAVTRTVKIKS